MEQIELSDPQQMAALINSLREELATEKSLRVCDRRGCKELNTFAKVRVNEIPANEYPVTKRRLKLWLWNYYRKHFKVDSYFETKVIDYDRAVKWILNWTPDQSNYSR